MREGGRWELSINFHREIEKQKKTDLIKIIRMNRIQAISISPAWLLIPKKEEGGSSPA